MSNPSLSRFRVQLAALVAVTLACAAVAWRWLPAALPTVALDNQLTPHSAERSAREFLQTAGFALSDSSRVAVNFAQRSEWQTYLELDAGGKAAVDTAIRRGDVPLFVWTVRFFTPGNPREYRVTLAPDRRVVGVERRLAESDRREHTDSLAALDAALAHRDAWFGDNAEWTLSASSLTVVPGSERQDRTFTFERADRRFGDAPIRLDVVVQGDGVGITRLYPEIPESFVRRYSEMRSANDLYAGAASAVVPVFVFFVILALVRGQRARALRWRPGLILGGIIGAAAAAAQLNALGLSWFGFDTASDPTTHLVTQILIGAVIVGVALAVLSTLLLVAGEYLTRQAFPQHFDWWRTPRDAGLRPVALRVAGGYAMAAFGLAYVSLFYLLVQRTMGWWSPTSLLDDPNLIATPLPWLSALAISLQAGILEEVLFRAVPLALLSRWVGDRPSRPWVMAAGVIVTALVFGFAHANYASWPAYARGVELFAESVLWGWLFLRFGLPVTVIGHFLYDLLLFGLFAAAGTDLAYRVTLVAIILLILAPALWTAWRVWRRPATLPEPDDARFGAYVVPAPAEAAEAAPPAVVVSAPTLDGALRRRAVIIALVGAGLAVAAALRPVRGPALTMSRADAVARAESLRVALGDPGTGWTVLTATTGESRSEVARYLRSQAAMAPAVRAQLDSLWRPPTAWSVRFVRTDEDVARRAESWRVLWRGDGTLLSWSHEVADSASYADASRDVARAAAIAALGDFGVPPDALVEVDAVERKRPNRLDVRFRFDDERVPLPGDAAARWVVTTTGATVLAVGREVHLPEEWQRTARAFDGRTTILVVIAGLLLVVIGARTILRRVKASPTMDDPPLWQGRVGMLVAALIVLDVLLFLNAWPDQLALYETSKPWRTHQLQSLFGLLFAAIGAALLVGATAFAEALRRRLVVPTVASREAVWAGALAITGVLVGLDGVQRLTAIAPRAYSADGANGLIPVLSSLGDVWTSPLAVLFAAALIGGAIHRTRDAAILLVLFAFATGSAGADSWVMLARGTLVVLAAYGAAAFAVRPFARVSVLSWLIAGALSVVVSALLLAVRAATVTGAVMHLLPAFAGGLVAWWLLGRASART